MRICILGAGHMGRWFSLVLSEGCFGEKHEVVVYDPYVDWERMGHETQVDRVAEMGIGEGRRLESLAELRVFNPELFINAVSLQHTISVFADALDFVPKETILCDIASVKTGLAEFYAKSGRRFVSLHPMFGPTFAKMEALRGENAILVRESDAIGKELFLSLFAKLGVKVFESSFAEHDRMMAYSLTTPFAASLVFASCVDETSVPGTTFARHKTIAKGLLGEDDHLLAEILFNPCSIESLDRITAKLEFLKHVIKARDFGEMQRLLTKLRKNLGKSEYSP